VTQRQRTLPAPQDPTDIRTSSDFLSYVEGQKINAQRRKDDLQGQVEDLERTNARLKADFEAATHRNNVLIADHRMAIDDEAALIAAAERALDFGRPAMTRQVSEEQESSD
jgi:hypothetical protein